MNGPFVEEHQKLRWCPEQRVAVAYGEQTIVTAEPNEEAGLCIGRGCMAWVHQGHNRDGQPWGFCSKLHDTLLRLHLLGAQSL